MTEPGQTGVTLSSALEDLVRQLRQHASVLSVADADPAEVVAAGDAVGGAADRYASEVFELTGWGSPFTPPPEDVPDHIDDDDDDGETGVARARYEVSAKYIIDVVSEGELRQSVISRDLAVERPPGEDEDSATACIAALFEADGWSFDRYSGSAVDGYLAEWSVGVVMDPDASTT